MTLRENLTALVADTLLDVKFIRMHGTLATGTLVNRATGMTIRVHWTGKAWVTPTGEIFADLFN